MTTKHKFISIYLVAYLTICSCGNTDGGKSNTTDTTTSQIYNKQEIELKSNVNIGGTYYFGEHDEGPEGSVIVYPLTDSSALFYFDLCRGAPNYNVGILFGQMAIKDNIGIFDSKLYVDILNKIYTDFLNNCTLRFEFNSETLTVETSSSDLDCGFGWGVNVQNTYKLIDKSIPKYFIVKPADTVIFEGLTMKKYYNID
jgi:hypothetical protein